MAFAGHACGGEAEAPGGPSTAEVPAALQAVLDALDPHANLLDHALIEVDTEVSKVTTQLARSSAQVACAWVEELDDKKRKGLGALSPAEWRKVREQHGDDLFYGLELARHVAGCYALARDVGQPGPVTRVLFLSIAADCAERRGTPANHLSRVLLALFDGQGMTITAYAKARSDARSDHAFSDYLVAATRLCPAQVSEEEEEASELGEGQVTRKDVEGRERVFLGILRGRAPGRLRLSVEDREIHGELTIFGRKIPLEGTRVGSKDLVLRGKLKRDTLELKGKFQSRGRKIRGRYTGRIRFSNQPRSSRVMGFWEASVDEVAPP